MQTHFIYECVTNMNHVPFEKEENFLFRTYLWKRYKNRHFVLFFYRKVRICFKSVSLFLLCHFIYKPVIKISCIQFERGTWKYFFLHFHLLVQVQFNSISIGYSSHQILHVQVATIYSNRKQYYEHIQSIYISNIK